MTSYLDTIQKRIEAMKRQQAKQASRSAGGEWYELKVSPTCPPSTSLFVRGGREFNAALVAAYNYRVYTIPDKTVDLTDPDQAGIDIAFSNANWYQVYCLLMKLPAEPDQPTADDWQFLLWGDGVELETSGEAEAYMEIPILVDSQPWYDGSLNGYPLCGIILRNNGTIGAGCPILPVDLVNRGRSYLWPPDVRPKRFMAES